jgi:hypothetical protein
MNIFHFIAKRSITSKNARGRATISITSPPPKKKISVKDQKEMISDLKGENQFLSKKEVINNHYY